VAITTYAELQTAVANWLNRSDLTSRIPEFIALAEARFGRHEAVRSERRETLSLATAAVTLPDDCREVTALTYDDGTRHGPIELIGAGELPLKKVLFSETGVPRFAAVVKDGTELLLAPAPDQTYTVTITYVVTFAALSATATTNWLLTGHPDLYLFGALVEAEPYLKDDDRLPMWKARLDEGLEELRLLIDRRAYSGSTPIMRPRRAIGGTF
jgi:hypothetical protein